MISILLVDDQPLIRQGLRMCLALEPDISVVGEANDGAEALELVGTLRPNVVVLDVEMPGLDGISAAAALRVISPATVVVILTIYEDLATRLRALAAGAAAFVSKHEAPDALASTIRKVVGRTFPGDS